MAMEDLGNQSCKYAHNYSQQVKRHHDDPCSPGEERARQEAVYGYLGGAAHERDEQDSQAPVMRGRQGAGSHNARHGASEADEHRHDAPAGEAKLAQQFVGDKRNARHVPAVFQHGQEKEQHYDDGDEAQHRAYTPENRIYDQRTHGFTDIPADESGVNGRT